MAYAISKSEVSLFQAFEATVDAVEAIAKAFPLIPEMLGRAASVMTKALEKVLPVDASIVAAVSIAHVGLNDNESPKRVVEMAIAAARASDASSFEVAAAVGNAAAIVVRETQGTQTSDVGSAAAELAASAGFPKELLPEVAGAAAAQGEVNDKLSASAAAKLAIDAAGAVGGASQNDIAMIAAHAAWMASIAAEVPSSEEVYEAALASHVANGLGKHISLAAAAAAIKTYASRPSAMEEAGKAAARVASETAEGSPQDIAQLVGTLAADAVRAAGGEAADAARAASAEAAKAAMNLDVSAGEVAEFAASAARAAGGSSLDAARSAGDAAAEMSIRSGAAPAQVAYAVRNAVSAAGGSPEQAKEASVAAAAKAAIAAGASDEDVAKAVADAVSAASVFDQGSVDSEGALAKVVGKAAADLARTSGQSAAEVAEAAAKAVKAAGGSPAQVIEAAWTEAAQTAIAAGMSPERAAKVAADAAAAHGGSASDIAKASGLAIKAAGGTQSEASEAAGRTAARIAMRRFLPTPEVAKVAADAARDVGGTREDVALAATVAAAASAIARGLSPAGVLREVEAALKAADPDRNGQRNRIFSLASIAESMATSLRVEVSSGSKDDVLLTRHGARIDKEDRRWLQKAGHGRVHDPHLSCGGELGAKELATRLASFHKDQPVAHIVSSPFVRCVQTAMPVAEALGLPIKIEPGICEILSSPDCRAQFLDTAELARNFPCIDESYQPVVSREQLPSVEYGDCAAARRAGSAAQAVREKLCGRILFVGHGASCLGIATNFGMSDYIGYTTLTHFAWDGARWRVMGEFGDVAHLSDQETARNSAF
eukprot:TRINITY_DN5046_c0_g1_i4.p1 TRINITY_DN5046_c0_g1~~TRINITY_DN5046_c0_g1_i4.p1  ORF type:complete len:878 (+),score=194.02 TRINITY_DN5046_c0_g1_i4:144-2636(+)